MKSLSVYLVVKNEEDRLERTLKAIRPLADEIVVVDSGSTDRTLEIARRHADKVTFHEWTYIADQKHYAESLCTNDWLLTLDADEVVGEQLAGEIRKWKADDDESVKAFRIYVADMFPGETRPKRWTRRYDDIRLYHRDFATMPADVMTDDRVVTKRPIPVGQFRGDVEHYSYQTLSAVIAKINEYTDVQVRVMRERGKRYSAWRLLVEFPVQFLRYYFYRRFFTHGLIGVLTAGTAALLRWVKIAKFIEAECLDRMKGSRGVGM